MDGSRRQESTPFSMKLRKDGSGHDFESLFQAYWAQIHGLLARMVADPAEAEDLALETFFRLHRYQPAFGVDFNVRGWLQRVATNLALQSIRSFRRREQYELQAGKEALEAASSAEPHEIFATQERQAAARQVLAGLNPRQAELLVLRYSGLRYKEIAAALGLAPSSIGPLLLRAEREFAKQYRALHPEEEP